METRRRAFAYRCARVNAYMQSYLYQKNIQHLLAKSRLLSYIFNTQDYPDAILLVSSVQFRWLARSSYAVTYLMQLIANLPNHCIFTSSAVLTAGDYIFTQNGVQMSEAEYSRHLAAEDGPLCLRFENTKTTELQAFLAQVVAQRERIAVDDDAIVVPDTLQKVSVENSLTYLLISHIDCQKIEDLALGAYQLRNIYNDVIHQLSRGNVEAAGHCCDVLRSASSKIVSKDFLAIDKDKRQSVLPGVVYDIQLHHPQFPIMYRTSYLLEDRNEKMESLVFAGCLSSIIEWNAFALICEHVSAVEDIEGKVLPILKKEMLMRLTRSLPSSYHQAAQATINTMKLLVVNQQIDGSDYVFCRCVTNISISLYVRHVVRGRAEIITLIFGRSFVATPTGFVQLNDLTPQNAALGFVNYPYRYNFNLINGSHELELKGVHQKLAVLRLGVLNTATKSAKLLKLGFQAVVELEQFGIALDVKYLCSFFAHLRPKQNSVAFSYKLSMSASQIPDSNYLDICVRGKSLVLIADDAEYIRSVFGYFACGMLYALAQGSADKFLVYLDFSQASAFGEVTKWRQANQDVEENYLEFALEEHLEEQNVLVNIDALSRAIYEQDTRRIFVENSGEYVDKMLEKLPRRKRERVKHKILLIAQLLPSFPYLQMQKLAVRYFQQEYGGPVIAETVQSEGQLQYFLKAVAGQEKEALFVVRAYFPYLFAIAAAVDAEFYFFELTHKPYLLLNTLTERAIPHFTSCGFFGVDAAPAHFVENKDFIFSFSRAPLAVRTLKNQLFLNVNMFSGAFQRFSPYAFGPEVSLLPVEVYLLRAAFAAKPHLTVYTASEFFRQREYAVAALDKLVSELKAAVSDAFLPAALVRITFGSVVVEVLQSGLFTADSCQCPCADGCVFELVTLSFEESALDFKALKSACGLVKSAICSEFNAEEVIPAQQQPRPSREELQQMYADKPLPYGWVKDGATFVSWSGEFSQYRPDIAELEEAFERSRGRK